MKRNDDYTLRFTKEGYTSEQVYISSHFNWMVFLFLGSLLDVATGAVYDLKPDNVLVSLVKMSSVPGPEKIDIVLDSEKQPGTLDITSSESGVQIEVIPSE